MKKRNYLDHVMPTSQPAAAAAQRHKTNNVAMSYTHSKHHHEHHWGPFFEEQPHLNGSVLTGTTTHFGKSATALQIGIHLGTEAILNCRVGMLRDKTVCRIFRTKNERRKLNIKQFFLFCCVGNVGATNQRQSFTVNCWKFDLQR